MRVLRLHAVPGVLRFVCPDDGEEIVFLEERAGDWYEKKYEQPRTWLCKKKSLVFSCPKSSRGSAQRISHISPCVGGSLNLSI